MRRQVVRDNVEHDSDMLMKNLKKVTYHAKAGDLALTIADLHPGKQLLMENEHPNINISLPDMKVAVGYSRHVRCL